jgi:hypothetical protein
MVYDVDKRTEASDIRSWFGHLVTFVKYAVSKISALMAQLQSVLRVHLSKEHNGGGAAGV